MSNKLTQNTKKLKQLSAKLTSFFDLQPEEDLKEVTNKILSSSIIEANIKETIKIYNRKIYIFKYPSDGLSIIGFINYAPEQGDKLMMILRGGNRKFGILNPASDLTCYKDYAIIGTLYRGGLSEGVDEFGGADVKDAKNLLSFVPTLEKKLNAKLMNRTKFLIGGSRGGMQIFLFLQRYPKMQTYFHKVVGLSGLYDLTLLQNDRPEMIKMFKRDFGLTNDNAKEWFIYRSPINHINQISSKLPILLIEGTRDIRAAKDDGKNMFAQLQAQGKDVTFKEFIAEHCLSDMPERMDVIAKWLES
ncbi:MAG: prolyl oligopeptidase family serine peptidase [Pseudomonadota bacterium]